MKAFIIFLLFSLSANVVCSVSYMALFSYDHKWIPGGSPHSFAVFYQMDERDMVTEDFTISWLPKEGPQSVSLFSGTVEGKNYSLEETLNYAFSKEHVVTLSGVYTVNKSLYLSAKQRKKQLEKGKVKYAVLFNERKGDGLVLHCVHAISDLFPEKKLMDTGWAYAETANAKIIEYFRYFIEKSKKSFPWKQLYRSSNFNESLVKQ